MANVIPESVKRDIKDRVSIKDLVEDYVRLQKDGQYYKGLCPFHKEKTPSFKIHEERGFFKCFGCGEYGDVFSFLMKVEGMSFPEALERLASRAGVELPKRELSEEEKKAEADKRTLFEVNLAAADFFHRNLLESREAEAARQYLRKRKIGDETIARFKLGYSLPGWSANLDYLARKGATIDSMRSAGLVIIGDSGKPYDRFRGRIMFPIMDAQAGVRSFGGRLVTDEKDQPKYLNGPETEIYKKGSGFFGVYQSKAGIRKKNRVIVVEGYFDQIALDQAGVGCAAATLGTAMTEEHARALRRLTRNVFMVFDSDEAGKKASARSLPILLEAGLSPRMVLIPEGKDPADYLENHDARDFERLLDASPGLLDYYIEDVLGKAAGVKSDEAEAVRMAAEMIGKVQDRIERGIYVDSLARKSGVDARALQKRVRRPEPRTALEDEDSKEVGGIGGSGAYPPAEFELAINLMHHPNLAIAVKESGVIEHMANEGLKAFVKSIFEDSAGGGEADPVEHLEKISDRGLVQRLSGAILESDPYENAPEKALNDSIGMILHESLTENIKKIKREMERASKEGNEILWRELAGRYKELEAERSANGFSGEFK